MSQTVFVSGATGFIAQHVVVQLLEKNYKVVGTVRSASKGDNLKKNLNSENFSYEIVSDLEKEGAFEAALEKHPEATVFIHTASPVVFDTKDVEKELLFPAVHGTKNVLTAIKNVAPQIKKVVITSSVAAVAGADNDKTVPVDETSWNDTTWEASKKDGHFGYYGSKTFAEKAAWDFVKDEKPNFTLSTINPSFVFGPQAFDSEVGSQLNLSNTVISNLLSVKPGDEVPQSDGSSVDVRDVAAAHILAFEKDEAIGKRLLLTNEDFTSQTILDAISKGVPELKGSISVGVPGSNPPAPFYNDKKSREILGLTYIDLTTTVSETVRQYLKHKTS
ncbi:putative NADPH-dependent methylglyoxal reductase Grp2p [[Candida] anglica]|uniref:NADPH-dependent methylglyoxal reductase Grp2p n=1 Tax=[Candida] anglica TaxID=148631 RepID=A0ABP0EI67_9ASCO